MVHNEGEFVFLGEWSMKMPVSVPSEVKAIEKRMIMCKNCHAITECSVFSAETSVKVLFIRAKKLHKTKFAVCPECKTRFYIDKVGE